MVVHPCRFLITGGPGTGKSTLLAALQAAGWPCLPEVSRAIIDEQHATGGRLLPWADLPGFALECEARMVGQLVVGSRYPVSFFDRGLPDIIAYLRHGGLTPPPRLFAASKAYAGVAFVAPYWPEIYRNDPARPQTRPEAEALDREIRRACTDCGLTVCELPRSDVASRVVEVQRVVDEFMTLASAH